MAKSLLTFGCVSFGALVLFVWSSHAGLQQPTLDEPQSPPIEEVMKLDPAEKAIFFDQQLVLHCGMCHGSEMIEQQRLTLAQWKAEVAKMIGWGATLPNDYQDLMAEHLHRKYPSDNTLPPPRIEPAQALAESLPVDSELVASYEKNHPEFSESFRTQCANCHGPEGEGNEIGLRLTSRAILTRPEEFGKMVVHGRGRMPAFGRTLSEDKIHGLRRWLLGRTYSWSAAD